MLASCRPCARCPRSRRSSGCRGSFCPCSGGACCIARSAVAARCRLLVSPLGVHPGGGPPASAVRAASFARSVVSEHGQAPHSRRLPGLSETGCASVGAGFARCETGCASVGAGFARCETGCASVGAGCVRSETAGTIVGEKRPFLVHFSPAVVPRVSCVGWAGLAVVPWVSCAGRSGLVVVSWVLLVLKPDAPLLVRVVFVLKPLAPSSVRNGRFWCTFRRQWCRGFRVRAGRGWRWCCGFRVWVGRGCQWCRGFRLPVESSRKGRLECDAYI